MARLARVEVFAPDEIAIIHVMNRTVRRCFLMGIDPLTGKNFDHCKAWFKQVHLHVSPGYHAIRQQLGELSDIVARFSEPVAYFSEPIASREEAWGHLKIVGLGI